MQDEHTRRVRLSLRLFALERFYLKMSEKTTTTNIAIRKKQLLTVREVADYLRVSRVTVWRWCQNGFIPAFRLGRGWRIRTVDLIEFEEALVAHGDAGKDISPATSDGGTLQP